MKELTTETQSHRETTTKTAKTQRSGEQEGFFSLFYLMLSSVPLRLCGELFLGVSRFIHVRVRRWSLVFSLCSLRRFLQGGKQAAQ